MDLQDTRLFQTPFWGCKSSKSCGDFMFAGLLGLEQLIEDGAVLDHSGAELFGAGFDLAGPDGDAVREAVVFHYAGVCDRDIVGALLETGSGIAARLKN